MKSMPTVLALLAVMAGATLVTAPPRAMAAEPPQEVRLLDKAKALPLALDDDFQFRKVQSFLHDRVTEKSTNVPMINFERRRADYGAITNIDRYQREGQYFRLFWRTRREANVTVRFEYRQSNLGSYVQAREVEVANARGSMETEFQITGDDYRIDGRVTAWRAVIIENGKIVGLTQSFLWN